MTFPPVHKEDILERIKQIDPVRYARSRNFHDGNITMLSPYISRGVITVKDVFDSLVERGLKAEDCESLVKELCWREYFQLVWENKGDAMFHDLHREPPQAKRRGMPISIEKACTGITAIDHAIGNFYETGYLHNHMRMYLAMLACNVGKCHWELPSKWMYYHLLDADAASNTCSWQWVSGAFSHKCYIANQENINRYFGTTQRGSFLDVTYAELEALETPAILQSTSDGELKTVLPKTDPIKLRDNLPVFVYHFYHLDPDWHSGEEANRILLLEPAFFERFPSSEKVMSFVFELAKQIPGLQIMNGTFDELKALCGRQPIHYIEHPAYSHYSGHAEKRKKIFPEISGYYPSFSRYWKLAEPLFYRAFKA
jgi:deoxyribodipyrimidine photo-lyase